MMGQKVVKIYPFPCTLTGKSLTVNGNVLKMTQSGFLFNSLEQPLKVHDSFQAAFTLPLVSVALNIETIVYRTFDEFKGVHGLIQPGNHVNEIVFKKPTSDLRKTIFNFLVKINATR